MEKQKNPTFAKNDKKNISNQVKFMNLNIFASPILLLGVLLMTVPVS